MSDIDFLRFAASISEWSDDTSTQNAAVIVPPGGNVGAAAWNGIPRSLDIKTDRLERPLKYRYVEHAERAAIYRAALAGVPTLGATMYCPWFACADCARAIICSGIKTVVGHARVRSATPDRWIEQVIAGEELLREAGVGLRWLSDHLDVEILFDGRRMML